MKRNRLYSVVISLGIIAAMAGNGWAAEPNPKPPIIDAKTVQQKRIPCDAFEENLDGNWSVVKTVRIVNRKQTIVLRPGDRIGRQTNGIDLETALMRQCMNR